MSWMVRACFLALVFVGIGAGSLSWSGAASAAASPWSGGDYGRLRLVSEGPMVHGKTLNLGLHFLLNDNWKIYWRAPGDAGFPPSLDWSRSENLGETKISWPAPLRFSIGGLQTVGYKNEVVLPISGKPLRAGEGVALRLQVSFLACAEICIPGDADLALDLPYGVAKLAPEADLIARYQARVPDAGQRHKITLEPLAGLRREGPAVLRVAAQSATAFIAPDLFVSGADDLNFGVPEISLADGAKRATFLVPVEGPADRLDRLANLVVTLVDEERSAERPIALRIETDQNSRSFGLVLALAFLGGLILNLMPCVLPVLSIKLLGVVSMGGAEKQRLRAGFLASSAGILASFMVLAGGLILLKVAGATIGWGIQFQQPWFLIAMALLLTLFACNLWGWLDIALPGVFGHMAGKGGHNRGLAGHFASGALATLLATPCSAPFLGTAVGFALARGPLEIVAVFALLGVGLAAPYLAVAAFPVVAGRLPKPGPWMERLRKLLSLALAGTALWLLSVLLAQVGVITVAIIGGLLLSIAATLAFSRGRRFPRWPAPGALVVAAFLVPHGLGGVSASAPEGYWRPFDAAAIPSLVAEGNTVFVDVTADWCISCLVNKAASLERSRVQARLSADKVVAMRADWTNPDPEIAAFLARFNRYGIPFNVVYGPQAPTGITLPELLSEEAVLSALDAAVGVGVVGARTP